MPLSLPSVLIAIVLFALMAGTLQPTLTASDTERLDAAAEELASILRLAHSESIRLGLPHGIIFDAAAGQLSVSVADTGSEPFVAGATVYHPIRKQPLQWAMGSWTQLAPSVRPFSFGSHGYADKVMFDRWGTPILRVGGVTRQLSTTDLSLTVGSMTKIVRLHSISGRVTIS